MQRIGPSALVALALACGPDRPDGSPMMDGVVVARTPAGDEPATVHVKEHPDDECGVIFDIDSDTRIFTGDRDGMGRLSPAQLTVGTEVRVWAWFRFDSCPGQSYAQQIEIL